MHRTKFLTTGVLALLMALIGAQGALASFGLKAGTVDATVLDKGGTFEAQAAAHPDRITTRFVLKTVPNPSGGFYGNELGLPVSSEANLRNVKVEAPPGLVGNPTATPRCSLEEFMGPPLNSGPGELLSACSDETQVGIAHTMLSFNGEHIELPSPIYNLLPQPGQPALFAFKAIFTPVFAVPSIRTESDYGINFNVTNIDETVAITANAFTFWGVPASPDHDSERGDTFLEQCGTRTSSPPCRSNAPLRAFLTNPSDCDHGPFAVRTEVQSWPGETGSPGGRTDSRTILTHDDEGESSGVTGCERVPFQPTIEAKATTELASSPSGLNFRMEIPSTGLENPDGLAQSPLKKAVITLPEGFTINPSAGEGMGVCTASQFAAEKIDTQPGEACPNGSRLGSVSIDSPLLEPGEVGEGSLYLAAPDDPNTTAPGLENPFDSLLGVYLVARVVDRAVIIKSAGKVQLDPQTGQITTTFDNLPQLPFSSFRLRLREGGRALLISPSSCGEKATVVELYPYSRPQEPTRLTSSSSISAAADGGSCLSGGLPPFKPGLIAGSLNNAAGRFSPFDLRLFRIDGEQEITRFSIKLPPGLLGKLAGVPFCPDSGISRARTRERIGGGREEQLDPSCRAASEIGHTLIGAGVGSVLTYVPGKVYLAGSYHGSPLSIVAITSGVVGPFDIGTVAIREALRINPETGEVFIDATGSDPIPHIVAGIATHIRDLRTYIDRPGFMLNPTNCTKTSIASTASGSGLDFASVADDNPLTLSTPFQVADCAALPFRPKLSFRLKGSTKRGGNPSLRAHVSMQGIGEAAIRYAQVALPRSEFLDNAHIETVCTRVQFREGDVPGEKCPASSIYGHVSAVTPILDGPLAGPIYLRSSEHKLPDLVATLHHQQISITLVGRVDSTKGGGIRNTFEFVPDAPVTSAEFIFAGGKKGLLENSTNACRGKPKVIVKLKGHNGKVSNYTTPLKATRCSRHRKGERRHKQPGLHVR